MDQSTAARFYASLDTRCFISFTEEIEKDETALYPSGRIRPRFRKEQGCGHNIPHLVGSVAMSSSTPAAILSSTQSSPEKAITSLPLRMLQWARELWKGAFSRSQASVQEQDSPASHAQPSSSPDTPLLAPRSLPQDALSQTITPPPALFSLPEELLLQIMRYLDPGSLRLLRQSSAVFCRLFGDKSVLKFHDETPKNTFVRFATGRLTAMEQEVASRNLQRDMYCDLCLQTRNASDWDMRLAKLQEKLFCDGCQKDHARFFFFFFPENIQIHEEGRGQLLCVGRLGWVTLCSHSTPQTTTAWRTIENISGYRDNTVCTHPSHRPLGGKMNEEGVSASPRMSLFYMGGYSGCEIAYGWDLPLLDLDQNCIPAQESIHEALIELLEGNLMSHRVCKHILRGRYLLSFVRSGICLCFSKKDRYLHPFTMNSRLDCFCDRQRYLTCHVAVPYTRGS